MSKLKMPKFRGPIGSRSLSAIRLKGSDYTVSIFGTVALAIAGLLYGFGLTFGGGDFEAFTTMIILLLIGIVFTIVMVGVPHFVPFSKKSLYVDAISTGTSVMAIYLVNKILPFQGSSTPISDTAFVTLSGVTEEWLFRMWLCAWIYKITGVAWLAIIISSISWSVFHTARYGGQPILMLLVFLAGLPLGAVTLFFRSSDGPSFAHALMNALAR